MGETQFLLAEELIKCSCGQFIFALVCLSVKL